MPFEPCETRLDIPSEWTDRNGHMNVAYYVLAFDRATDTLYDALGIGWSYLDRAGKSMFTLAMNVDYLGEVFAGDSVHIKQARGHELLCLGVGGRGRSFLQ